MLYALICICLISEPVCDAEHAIWAEQSPPLFDTEDECQQAALAHVAHANIPNLEEDTEYQIDVECTATSDPV